MAKIKIITDTGADIPQELIKKHNLKVFPFLSIFGEDTYRTGEEFTSEAFFKKLADTGMIPTTAQTPYPEMDETLREYIKEYDTIIIFTLSAKASGQNNSLQMITRDIKEEFPDADIRVIDSETFSIGYGMTAVYASMLAEEGLSADEIVEKSVEYLKSWDVYFIVDSLTYLEKGGRINKASAVIGTLLDIKPVLSIRGGLVEAIDKFRGKKNLLKKLVAKIKENPEFDAEAKQFGVVHSDKEMGEELARLLKEEFEGAEIVMYNMLGPIIGTHTGPGLAGAFFRKKSN